MKPYYKNTYILLIAFISVNYFYAQKKINKIKIYPTRTEIVQPIRKPEFRNPKCKQRKQGGNPREVSGYLAFDGSMDGNRQVDPQIAVGGGYVLHGSNSGIVIYDKKYDSKTITNIKEKFKEDEFKITSLSKFRDIDFKNDK